MIEVMVHRGNRGPNLSFFHQIDNLGVLVDQTNPALALALVERLD